MVDFGKINPEVIKALKDGRINEQEAKRLGLDEKVVKELNEAFSKGAAEVGDFVVVNKGRTTKNGKPVQLSQVKKNPNNKNNGFKIAGYIAGGVAAFAAVAAFSNPVTAALVVGGAAALASCNSAGDDVTEVKIDVPQNTNVEVKLSAEVKAGLGNLEALVNQLIKLFPDISKSLNNIKTDIASLRQNSETQLKEVIDLLKDTITAITKGNDTLASLLTAINDKIGKNHEDDLAYQTKVLNLLADLRKMMEESKAEGYKFANALFNAIGKIQTGNLDVSGIEALLKQLVEGQKTNGDKLDKLADLIEKSDANVCGMLAKILEAIKGKPDYSERLDKILAKLESLNDDTNNILNKINIVIEGDRVKVSCNCGCSGGTHEGIIGNIEDLLN